MLTKSIFALTTLALLALPSPAPAQTEFTNGQPADLVLFQPDFTSMASGTSARRVFIPSGIAIDPTTGKLFVVDSGNNRILRLPSVFSLTSNSGAEAVFGQPNFASGSNGLSQTQLSSPNGITVDQLGRLWVADTNNNRVLMWEAASFRSTGASADAVFGQSTFAANAATTAANGMDSPRSVLVDGDDRLWVSETGNNRVLRFDSISSKLNGTPATAVLGQPDFNSNTPGTTATTLRDPYGLAFDASGRLWVADASNARVLRFDNAASKPDGAAADGVLGQADFVTSTPPPPVTSASFSAPVDVTLAPNGDLWVSDINAGRALGFSTPALLANGAPASRVLGQANFTTVDFAFTARGPIAAFGITFDGAGRLWTSNNAGHRVLRITPTAVPAPAVPTAPTDATAPTIKVKGRRSIDSLRNRVVFRGTASDDTDVAGIEFKVSGQAGFQVARGTTSWKAVVRPDKNKRKTVVRVRAIDSAGNKSSFLKLKVFRR